MARNPTTRKGIEQGRAKFAFDKVRSVSENAPDSLKKSYKSVAKKLPVLIKTNGLGQTLAFVNSKGGQSSQPNGYDKLYEQIGSWLQSEDDKGLVPEGELVEEIIQLDSPEYRQVTVETLALLNWIRRFADGLMKDVEPDDD